MTCGRSITGLLTRHRLKLLALSVWILTSCIDQSSRAKSIDGFFMYCTSNQDGTGACTNEEDLRNFTCIIVPGQIITCPAEATRTVDCVWISGASANQAQFWCDREDEAAMYGKKQTVEESEKHNSTGRKEIEGEQEEDTFGQTPEPGINQKIFMNAF